MKNFKDVFDIILYALRFEFSVTESFLGINLIIPSCNRFLSISYIHLYGYHIAMSNHYI